MHHTRNGHPCGILFAFHCAGLQNSEGKPYNKESLVVVKSPETVKVDFSEEAGQTVLKSSILKILVNPATGGISFHTIAGNELLKDKDYGTSFADKNDAGTPSYQVRALSYWIKTNPSTE